MSVTLHPVRVATGVDEEGVLVFDDERRLVAILTHLSDQYRWGVRALVSGGGLRPARGKGPPHLRRSAAAEAWLNRSLAARP